MSAPFAPHFNQQYQTHLKHLRLKGLRPKTIEANARAIRRIGKYFEYRIEDLSEQQLTDYFTDLLNSHSWSAVKLDLKLFGVRSCNQAFRLRVWMPAAFSSRCTARLTVE